MLFILQVSILSEQTVYVKMQDMLSLFVLLLMLLLYQDNIK